MRAAAGVLQACSGRFPCKCGPRPRRAGRLRGSAPPTPTPLGFQPWGRSSWVFGRGQYLAARYSLSLSLKENNRERLLRLRAPRVFVVSLVHLLVATLPRIQVSLSQIFSPISGKCRKEIPRFACTLPTLSRCRRENLRPRNVNSWQGCY